MLISLDNHSHVFFWSVTTEAVLKSFSALADPLLTARMPIVGMLLAKLEECGQGLAWAHQPTPKPKTNRGQQSVHP